MPNGSGPVAERRAPARTTATRTALVRRAPVRTDSGAAGPNRRLRPAAIVRRLVPALIALCLAAGCATVPTGGPMFTGHAVESGDPLSDPYVRMVARPPQPGWTEKMIVEGFLRASASFEHGQAVARQYLSAQQATRWHPSGHVAVYDREDPDNYVLTVVKSVPGKTATVEMSASHVADIGPDGDYVTRVKQPLKEKFHLAKVRGQWRITDLPSSATNGLLLSRRDVKRAYRPLNLYFYDSRYQTLVPDSVMIPVQSRSALPTTLVRSLLSGPTKWLAPAVRTAFPANTKLRGTARLSGGTVTVDLDPSVSQRSDSELTALSAQLVWTLRQLPEMRQLRLKINGSTVDIPGVTDSHGLQPRDAYADRDPSGLHGAVQPYFVRDGGLYVLAGNKPAPVDGPAAGGVVDLRHPAISFKQDKVAALSTKGDRLYVATLADDGKLVERFHGHTLTTPSWDRYGHVWFADRHGGKSDVWLLDRERAPIRVESEVLDDREVYALRVARDGSRVALLVGSGTDSKIMIGPIVWENGTARIGELRRLATDLEQVSDVSWQDADTLAALGKGPRGAVQPYRVPINGTQVAVAGYAGAEAKTITAAPGRSPLLVGAKGDRIWRGSREDANWQNVAHGRDPAYPG